MSTSRTPPSLLLLLIAPLAGGCRQHPTGAVAVESGGACVTCHLPDYRGANDPVHLNRMPDACEECHTVDAWHPAVELGHPEAFFPIASGDHAGILCIHCHDPSRGPSIEGQNTDCIGCHTGEHEQSEVDPIHGGVPDYRFQPDVPNFCLGCHPDGRAEGHPESAFPISRGAHSGIACGDCHDASLGPSTGGQNVSCIGCHTGEHSMARMADRHSEVGGYRWQPDNPDFCRSCHPNGSGGDD
jgi:hypothetical protein